MDIFESTQRLVQKILDVIVREVLSTINYPMKVSLHQIADLWKQKVWLIQDGVPTLSKCNPCTTK